MAAVGAAPVKVEIARVVDAGVETTCGVTIGVVMAGAEVVDGGVATGEVVAGAG